MASHVETQMLRSLVAKNDLAAIMSADDGKDTVQADVFEAEDSVAILHIDVKTLSLDLKSICLDMLPCCSVPI